MKKLLLLALTAIMMVSCEHKQERWNRYEVLLTTHDTIYIEAYDYKVVRGTYVFREQNCRVIMEVTYPYYVKQLKDK